MIESTDKKILSQEAKIAQMKNFQKPPSFKDFHVRYVLGGTYLHLKSRKYFINEIKRQLIL